MGTPFWWTTAMVERSSSRWSPASEFQKSHFVFDCCCCHAPPASSFLTAVLQCVLSLLQRAMCVGVESPPGFGRTAAFTFGWCCASMRCSLLNKNHRHSTLEYIHTSSLPCCYLRFVGHLLPSTMRCSYIDCPHTLYISISRA